MSTTFDSPIAFALHLAALEVAVHESLHRGLERALVVLENDAKGQIGHYQGAHGDFPAWAPLADSTEREKQRIGAPADAPLLRHGGMYASFGHSIEGHDGVMGSTDPTMVFHEFGTSKMPPRPVIGPAVVKQRKTVEQILGAALVHGLLGGQVTAGGTEYLGGDIKP